MQSRLVQRLPPCVIHHRPFIAPRRTYSAETLPSDALGPLEQDEHNRQSVRVVKDGKKLPLPPLLDPVVRSKRSQWQQPKAQPNVANFTPFQKKLWENSFAHALASPVRECRATRALLPSSLLITLHPRPHPTTTAPWLLPVSLTTSTHHLGPAFRFLAHSFIATNFGRKRVWARSLTPRFMQKFTAKEVDALVWREDMATLVRDLMRKRLKEKLAWWFGWRGRIVWCASPRTEDLEGVEDVSCVLYLDSLRTHADELQEQVAAMSAEGDKWASYFVGNFPQFTDPHKAEGVTHKSPSWYVEPLAPRLKLRLRFPQLEFKTTVWRGRKVPVYSLWDLLGEERLKDLVEGSEYEGARCLILKRGRQNVPLEMLLMQLQAYLAEPGP